MTLRGPDISTPCNADNFFYDGKKMVGKEDPETKELSWEKAPVAKIGDVKYQTVKEAAAAAQPGDTIEMIDDSVETETVAFATASSYSDQYTLDLKGHTLTGNGTSSVISVASGVYATIKDTSTNHSGKITQSAGNGPENGGAVYSAGYATLENVTITNCRAQKNGGAIYGIGRPLLRYVTITYCTAAEKGGAIYNGKNTELYDCTISGCIAQDGAGIYNAADK